MTSDTLIEMQEASLVVWEQPPSVAGIARAAWGRLRTGRPLAVGPAPRRVLLDGVSLRINEGDRIGILGENGAGKTTLLRVLGQIYPITSGDIVFRCKPTGIFAAGSGLMDLATGVENIYLKSMNLGLSKRQIDVVRADVIAFAGLGEHIDRPVQNYSTGMRLRLAIAITLMLKPDLLLLDEWIGSADEVFRARIHARLHSLIDEGRGLVLTSHNEDLLRRVCGRGVVMSGGRIVFEAGIEDAIAFYNERGQESGRLEESQRNDQQGSWEPSRAAVSGPR